MVSIMSLGLIPVVVSMVMVTRVTMVLDLTVVDDLFTNPCTPYGLQQYITYTIKSN